MASTSTPASFLKQKSTTSSAAENAFNGVGNLIKHLPSGTVFLFQFLSPLLTNNGQCTTLYKYLSGALLFICGFSCCFSCFTDSYIDPTDGKLYYGIVTGKGLWLFTGNSNTATSGDLSKYKLRFGDFVHAAFSLLVFAVIALLDNDIVSCYYASLASEQKTLLRVLPTVVGVCSGSVFMLFPDNRNEIGYPPKETKTMTTTTATTSNDS